ncbi:hypothetical protein C5167_007287 [Papaver somniferum]|uniref:uncharacterized protein LOC113344463 n=1 Tax=Papaver somniferum TaxID=3469 RepID=UPI000E7038CA|nr:uncharacterized protein LOC113344463 [Papaver somniferum]RZC93476.1 hypothetical protein C5167_007287 [Papaver somniferum]
MATTSFAALEHSLQNLSLMNHAGKSKITTPSDDDNMKEEDTTDFNDGIELNSDIPLPLKWEQCLDLKTGEVYYRNKETGKKSRRDPRKAITKFRGRNDYLVKEENSSDSEQRSPSPSTSSSKAKRNDTRRDQVLVVAGCKSCMMYFMLPKYVVDCPKCCGIILHFDRFQNGS